MKITEQDLYEFLKEKYGIEISSDIELYSKDEPNKKSYKKSDEIRKIKSKPSTLQKFGNIFDKVRLSFYQKRLGLKETKLADYENEVADSLVSKKDTNRIARRVAKLRSQIEVLQVRIRALSNVPVRAAKIREVLFKEMQYKSDDLYEFVNNPFEKEPLVAEDVVKENTKQASLNPVSMDEQLNNAMADSDNLIKSNEEVTVQDEVSKATSQVSMSDQLTGMMNDIEQESKKPIMEGPVVDEPITIDPEVYNEVKASQNAKIDEYLRTNSENYTTNKTEGLEKTREQALDALAKESDPYIKQEYRNDLTKIESELYNNKSEMNVSADLDLDNEVLQTQREFEAKLAEIRKEEEEAQRMREKAAQAIQERMMKEKIAAEKREESRRILEETKKQMLALEERKEAARQEKLNSSKLIEAELEKTQQLDSNIAKNIQTIDGLNRIMQQFSPAKEDNNLTSLNRR